ncbi:hypothetical protein AGOR_G00047220 [Albula goreensis]|uniref:Cilia- and flagella-associated protein 57 n=1 Tax=Albula goreensis TaxID=1534307 RepID=A0A8T3DXN7_9TELE|nr:hypothetical protein AGOR_G00047220 [Albula goreensis]
MSELGEKGTITVYELYEDYIRKRKVLSGEETPVQEFVSIAFSHDSQFLIGQSGEPDWTLFLWIWQRQKLIYTIKTGGPTTPIYKVSFNPHDHNQICVCGNGVFKLFSYVERALKQTNTQKQEPLNYLSHDWVSENQVIVGSDTGQLLLFKHEALQWKTNLGETHDSERTVEKQEPGEICVTAIAASLKGFACSAGPGMVYLFQMTKEKDGYNKIREIQVRLIIWSEDDSRLVSRDADGAVYEWNIHSSKLESEIVHKSYMYTSVALSPDAKTIFVMGTDFTLKQIQETKILSEVPTGDVTYTTITVSRSGKVLFCGTSVGTVTIISCPLFEPKNLFQYQGRGHTAPITKICVTYDDQFLLTTSEDGSVLIWRIIWNSYYQKKDSELCYLEEIFITKSDLEKKENFLKLTEASHVQKEMDHKSAEIEKLKLELQKRQNVVAGLNKDIASYKRQIKLRNNNIDEKEKCITKLRKMITDLEKSKFLMDYKNKELLNKIEPNERTIETMRERIQEMESELEETERENSQMELMISELRLRLKASDTEKRQEMQRASDIDIRMQRLKSDLQHCVEFIQDPKKLKEGILMLHKNYLESSDVECIHRQDAELQANTHQIFFEREDMARNALCAIKNKMARDTDMHQTYTFRMMKENIALMTEINSLRYKLILFEDQLQACTAFLELNQMVKKSQEEESKIVTSTPLPWFKEVEEPTGAIPSLEEAGELQSPSVSTKAQAETSPPGCPAKKEVSTSIQQLQTTK